jgi:hypothetical protein
MLEKIVWIGEQTKKLKSELGLAVYQERKKKTIENLKRTFQSEILSQDQEDYKAALQVEHQQSAQERATGVDLTPAIKLEIPINKIYGTKPGNLLALKQELRGRLANQDNSLPAEEEIWLDNAKITAVKQRIKEHEKNRLNLDTIPTDVKPLHTEYDDYEWDDV